MLNHSSLIFLLIRWWHIRWWRHPLLFQTRRYMTTDSICLSSVHARVMLRISIGCSCQVVLWLTIILWESRTLLVVRSSIVLLILVHRLWIGLLWGLPVVALVHELLIWIRLGWLGARGVVRLLARVLRSVIVKLRLSIVLTRR